MAHNAYYSIYSSRAYALHMDKGLYSARGALASQLLGYKGLAVFPCASGALEASLPSPLRR